MAADTAFVSLDKDQNRWLAALTIGTARELAGATLRIGEGDRNTRMAQVEDIVLVDHPADKNAPRLICVYQVDLLDFRGGKMFRYEPDCLLYSYEWLHKGTPPDYRLVLTRDPASWYGYVTALLLAGLNREAPHLFEPLHATN